MHALLIGTQKKHLDGQDIVVSNNLVDRKLMNYAVEL